MISTDSKKYFKYLKNLMLRFLDRKKLSDDNATIESVFEKCFK